MKTFLHGMFFVIMLAVIGYIMVSTAAKHIAVDNAKLETWYMDTALSRR